MSDFDFGFKSYSPLFCIIDVSIYYYFNLPNIFKNPKNRLYCLHLINL